MRDFYTLVTERIKGKEKAGGETILPFFDSYTQINPIAELVDKSRLESFRLQPIRALGSTVMMQNEWLSNTNLKILSCLPYYNPPNHDESKILSVGMIHVLNYYLPATLHLMRLKLLYSPRLHGTSPISFHEQL